MHFLCFAACAIMLSHVIGELSAAMKVHRNSDSGRGALPVDRGGRRLRDSTGKLKNEGENVSDLCS